MMPLRPDVLTEIQCGKATFAENPALNQTSYRYNQVQSWCRTADVNAVCVNGKVVVNGKDTFGVCKPLCRC